MKNIFTLFIILSLSIVSCKSGDQKNNDAEAVDPSAVVGVQYLDQYCDTTDFKLGSDQYRVILSCHSDTSLAHVLDLLEHEYYDNCADVSITQNGKEVCRKTFTKSDFRSYMSAQDMKSCALLGMSFEEENTTVQAFQFCCKLGVPGPEDGPSFIVKISNSGAAIDVKVDDRQIDMGEENLI